MGSRSRTTWVGLLLVVCLPLGGAAAEGTTPQDPAEEEPLPPFVLPPVEVEGKREAPPSGLPAPADSPTAFGTTLRGGERLGQRQRLEDFLLQAPGLTVRHLPGGSTLGIRGASPDQTLIFLDGIRLNAAAGGGLDLQTLPLELLEEMTILRGNEGARYGAGALGGVALLRTRDALGPTHLRASAGSFGTYALSGSLSGGGPSRSGLVALSLDRTAGDYPAAFDPTPSGGEQDQTTARITNNDAERAALLAKGGTRWGDVWLHGLTLGSVGERGLPGTLYLRDTQRRADRRLLAAIAAEPWRPGELAWSGGLAYRRDETSVWGARVPSVISQPVTPGGAGPWQTEQGVEARTSVELTPWSFTTLRLDGSVEKEWMRSPYHGDPERDRFSVGAVDELRWGDVFTLSPAVRYDRIGSHEGISSKVGASLRPTSSLELRANVGTSFRAPSLGELYLVAGPVQPNPELRPERSKMVDGGVILRLPSTLVQMSAFLGRTEDLISYEIVSGGRSKPFNFLDAEVVGGEIETSVRPTPWLSMAAAYGLARTKNLLDDPRFLGKELPYRPAHRLFGRMAVTPDGWEGYVEGHHQSSQWTNRSNSVSLPAQTWFGVGAGRRLASAPWELWLSGQADNLFDAHLVDQLGFPRPGRAFFFTLRASMPDAPAT